MNGRNGEPKRFRVYAPAALASIGNLPDTIMDRAVIVRMRRRAPGERIRDYRERTTRPEGDALRDLLTQWAANVAGQVGDPWPDLPPGVADRPADVWEPLLMIADLAGGDWPKLAAEACTVFVTGARDDTGSTGTRLLADLRDVFGDAPQLFTQTILDKLRALGESPWAEWSYGKPFSARDLADMLKEHQVKSHQLRIGEDSRKGYRRADLEDAWTRYLPGGSETAETSETPQASDVSDVSDVSFPWATAPESQEPHCGRCGRRAYLASAARAGRATVHPVRGRTMTAPARAAGHARHAQPLPASPLAPPSGAHRAHIHRTVPHRCLIDRARDGQAGQVMGGAWQAPKGWRKIRAQVFAAKGKRCHWCGAPATTVDHVVPLAAGGGHGLANLVPACRRCNSRRGAQFGNRRRSGRPRPRRYSRW